MFFLNYKNYDKSKYQKNHRIKAKGVCYSVTQSKENEICYWDYLSPNYNICFFDLHEKNKNLI